MILGARIVLGCAMIAAALLHPTTSARAGEPLAEFVFSPAKFPLASDDSRATQDSFDARSMLVIRTNACGQEPTYAWIRAQLAHANYDNEGERLTQLLIAKIQWLLTQTGPCEDEFTIQQPEEANPVGDEDVRLQNYVRRIFGDDSWRDPNLTCSAATSPLTASIVTDENGMRNYQIKVHFHVERDCLKQQINSSIQAMRKHGKMGTPLPFCLMTPISQPGEYDFTVKELVRILYLSGAAAGRQDILEPATVTHMYKELLSARGALGPATFNVVDDCANTAGEELGTPQEFADRQSFAGDFLSTFEEGLDWDVNFFAKIAVATVLTGLVPPAILALEAVTIAGFEDPVANLANAPFDVRIPETENHRLLIESSRYLTNAAIIKALKRAGHDNVDEIAEQQKEVREWLLKDLQRIAIKDFDEYNSRPYTQESIEAILNLHDFADDGTPEGDRAMHDAARIVLDLSSAKFAAGSDRGRRIVPYRRRAKYEGSDYLDVEGTDYEVSRAPMLAGQTQPFEDVVGGPTPAQPDAPEVRSGAKISLIVTQKMVHTATSTYRLPLPILEVAAERIFPFEQVVKHAGVEVYYAAPAFTMSLGGVRRPAALAAMGVEFPDDRGIAMPTNLIPTMRGRSAKDTFQFAGAKTGTDRVDNLCGWKGFICGIKPVFPSTCVIHDSRPDGTTYHFVNSALFNPGPQPNTCSAEMTKDLAGNSIPVRTPGPHFFLAAKTAPCNNDFCPSGQQYGVMEMTEESEDSAYSQGSAYSQQFQTFMAERERELSAWQPDRAGDGTYRNTAGETIDFRVAEADKDVGGSIARGIYSRIWNVNGVLPYGGPMTDGEVIRRSAPRKVSITSPWSGATIDIDVTDWSNPHITDVPALPGGRAEIYRVPRTGGGVLAWYKHWRALGPQPGEHRFQGPKTVAKEGWGNFAAVTAAIGSPVIYAMQPNGDLFWYRHDGFRTGSDSGLMPSRIGNGWDEFDKIIAGEDGVIYGRLPDGTLRWFRHLGHADGSVSWTEPKDVGTGWDGFIEIFAGSSGVLYGIRPNGDLMWYQHVGHLDGSPSWIGPRKVGNGWQNMKAVLSVGHGVIYGIDSNGNLIWYQHLGYETGEDRFADNVTIDTGWSDFKLVFALSPSD
jgi:hypothetical protein